MKTRLLKLTATAAAAVITGISLMPGAAGAAESCPANPTGSAIAIIKNKHYEIREAIADLTGAKKALEKVPYIGKTLLAGFFGKLEASKLKPNTSGAGWHDSERFGRYFEYKKGKSYFTAFNIGDYNGDPRWMIAYSYDGVLKTPKPKGNKGVRRYFPGMELDHPVIFFRLPTGLGSVSTPQIKGPGLKTLPGKLGEIADKAAKITRTLRLPLGALMIAGWKPTGVLKNTFELMNFPSGKIYLMAGSGIESYLPGGTEVGKCNVDPLLASATNLKTLGADDDPSKRGEEFRDPRAMLPDINMYVKISVPGKWKNPLFLFERDTYAEDAVVMVSPDGSISSWGAVRNFYGKDFVYTIDTPALLDPKAVATMKAADFKIGYSVKELTLADNINIQLGLLTKFADTKFLQRLSKAAGWTGSNEAKWAAKLFGLKYEAVKLLREGVRKGLDALPLDQIKITNKEFVDYDPVTQEFPPSTSFNSYIATGNGITATGERAPIMVVNGTFEFFGAELSSTKAILSLKTGVKVWNQTGVDIKLGTVLDTELRMKGLNTLDIVMTRKEQRFENHFDMDILGMAKGEAKLAFKMEGKTPRLQVLFDPSSGCAPPVPLKIDAEIDVPLKRSQLARELVKLIKGAGFAEGGITNCAGKVYEWTKTGVKYIGKGTVIGGKYVAEGANYAAKYGQEGAKLTAKYTSVGAKHVAATATQSYNKAANAISSGGKTFVNFAVNAGDAIKNLGNKIGCKLGLGGCPSKSKLPLSQRVPSPFHCPDGYFFSLEFGQCWKVQSALYAYTGTPTDGPKCLTATAGKSVGLKSCDGGPRQQFHADGKKLAVRPDVLKANAKECLVPRGGTFAPNTPLVTGSCANALAVALEAKTGRLVARHKNTSLCVRPDSSPAHRSAHGVLADWDRIDGRSFDVSVNQSGHIFVVGTDGKVWESRKAGWASIGGSPSNLVRVDSGIPGDIWAIEQSGAIHHRSGKWMKVQGRSTDIAAGGPEASIVVSLDTTYKSGSGGHGLWLSTNKGKTWTRTKGHGMRVDVDGAGGIWMVQNQGWVWHRDAVTKKWTKMPTVPGGARDISAGLTGTVMVTTLADEIYMLSGDRKKWQRFPGMGMNIAVGPDGSPVVGVDVGPHKGIVFAHKSATFTEGLKTVGQLDAFAQSHKTGDVGAVLDTCDPTPVSTAWSQVGPKVKVDYAAKAKMRKSFQLVNRHFYNNDWKRALGFDYEKKINTGNPVNWAQFMDREYQARTEYSAVFTGENRFALYHHVTGMCMHNLYKDRTIELRPCTFDDASQLWSFRGTKNKDRRIIYGQGEFCLAPSLIRTGFAGDRPQMVHRATPEWNANCKPGSGLGWHVIPYGTQMSSREFELDPFYSGKAVMLQVKRTNACLDSGVKGMYGQAYQWQCRPGARNHEFYIEWKPARDMFRIRNRHATNDNLCLEIHEAKKDNGAAATQWTCDAGRLHHHWIRVDVDKEWFQLKNVHSNKCLDLMGGDKRPGGLFHMYTCNKNNANQLFRVVEDPKAAAKQYNPEPFWTGAPVLLQVNATKACLDASVGQPARAKQWQCNPGNGSHKFYIERVAKGAAFELRNQHPGNQNLCLDVKGGSRDDGAEIVQWQCNNGNNQHWTRVEHGKGWFSLKNVHSGKCLDLAGGDKRPGATFSQYSCRQGGHPNQMFRAVASAGWAKAAREYKVPRFWTGQSVLLQVKRTLACLDASVGQHARAKQWQCNGGVGNHKFFIKTVGAGTRFELRNQHSGNRNLCLDVKGGNKANGAEVIQWPCNGGNNQKWVRLDRGNGWFSLQNVHTHTCLDLTRGDPRARTPFQMWSCAGNNANQLFRAVEPAGWAKAARQYTMDPFWAGLPVMLEIRAHNQGMCLDSSPKGQGHHAYQWKCTKSAPNHKFKVDWDGSRGTFRLINQRNSMCMEIKGDGRNNRDAVIQWNCNGGYDPNQHWRRIYGNGPWFQLQNVHSGLCMDLANGDRAPGAYIGQYRCVKGEQNQMFRVKK